MGISSALDSRSAHATGDNWEPRLTEDAEVTWPTFHSFWGRITATLPLPHLFLPNKDVEYLKLNAHYVYFPVLPH